jgi:hypothetical protein
VLNNIRVGHSPTDSDRIPLLTGEKQQKQPIQALCRPNATLQVIDLFGLKTKFRYIAEQRNFSTQTAEFYG